MGSFGGFYKGEKKKSRKGQQKVVSSNISVFSLPKIITKKKKYE